MHIIPIYRFPKIENRYQSATQKLSVQPVSANRTRYFHYQGGKQETFLVQHSLNTIRSKPNTIAPADSTITWPLKFNNLESNSTFGEIYLIKFTRIRSKIEFLIDGIFVNMNYHCSVAICVNKQTICIFGSARKNAFSVGMCEWPEK